MMTIDQIHDIKKSFVDECTKKDEDELNEIPISDIKTILEKHLDVLTPDEIELTI